MELLRLKGNYIAKIRPESQEMGETWEQKYYFEGKKKLLTQWIDLIKSQIHKLENPSMKFSENRAKFQRLKKLWKAEVAWE